MGYRDNQLFLKEDLEENGTVYIATEDGSVGTKGNVMNAIEENALQADVIFACGPMPMLRAIKKYAGRKGNQGLYLSGRAYGLWRGCLPGLRGKDQRSGSSFSCA